MGKTPAALAFGFLITAAVVVPLVTLPASFSMDPIVIYYGPKIVFSAIAAVLGWLALLVANRTAPLIAIAEMVFVRGLSIWMSAVMLVVLIAAVFGGENLWSSLIGSPTRLDGALVIVTAIHLMQMAHALVRERLLDTRNVTSTVIAGGSLVALILLMEKSGTHAWGLFIPTITPIAEPISTVGNIEALTNLLSVMFVLAVASTVTSRGRRIWMHWMAAAVLAAGIAVHGGRASVTAAVIALLIASILLITLRRPRWYLPALGCVLLAGTIFIGTVGSARGAERVQQVEVLVPGAAVDPGLQLRFMMWEIGLRSVLENPLLGTGTSSFADRVWEHATPAQERLLFSALLPDHLVPLARRSGRVIAAPDAEGHQLRIEIANFDKAHNYFIDVGVAYGAPAMLMLGLMWIALLFAGWVRFRMHPELLTTALAYLAAAQFWYFSVNVDPAIYVALGALSATSLARAREQAEPEPNRASQPKTLVARPDDLPPSVDA